MTTAINYNTTFTPAFPELWEEAIAEVAAMAREEREALMTAIQTEIEEADKTWLTASYTTYTELCGKYYTEEEIADMEAAMAPSVC